LSPPTPAGTEPKFLNDRFNKQFCIGINYKNSDLKNFYEIENALSELDHSMLILNDQDLTENVKYFNKNCYGTNTYYYDSGTASLNGAKQTTFM
jgi:hypothetical protein